MKNTITKNISKTITKTIVLMKYQDKIKYKKKYL